MRFIVASSFLCWLSASTRPCLLHILLQFYFASITTQMGFKLFLQAAECYRTYMPRPPPLPDPIMQTVHIFTPPFVSTLLLWYTGCNVLVPLQFISIYLACSLLYKWFWQCVELVSLKMDEIGCQRDKIEVTFHNNNAYLSPSPTIFAKFSNDGHLLLFTHIIRSLILLKVLIIRRSISLMKWMLFFGLEAIRLHLRFCLGDDVLLRWFGDVALLLLAGLVQFTWRSFVWFLSRSDRSRFRNVYEFFRFDIFTAWSDSGDSLSQLQHDLSELLLPESLQTNQFTPDWFDSCNDPSVRNRVIDTMVAIETEFFFFAQPSYNICTEFYSPSKTLSFIPSKPPWKLRRWLHRTTISNSSISSSVPAFVPPAIAIPTEQPSFLRLERLHAFIDSFNPATAGISILDAERYHRLHLDRPPPPSQTAPPEHTENDCSSDKDVEHTTVHLRNCAKTILQTMRSNQVIPRYFANVHEVIGSI